MLLYQALRDGDLSALSPFTCRADGEWDGRPFSLESPDEISAADGRTRATLLGGRIRITRELSAVGGRAVERVRVANLSDRPLRLDGLHCATPLPYADYGPLTLSAVPFTVQQDGWRHEYSVAALKNSNYYHIVNAVFPDDSNACGNSVYSDSSRPEPPLIDAGLLRSEAWALHDGVRGVLVIKHNERDVEYCLAAPRGDSLVLGGAGLCLYGEPDAARDLAPGQEYAFGETLYIPYEGDLRAALYIYRDFLNENGHGLPEGYDPPVHWNELYDVGWHHSRRAELLENYNPAALEREAAKAVACSCEQLYLDPGWEFAEGLGLWDNQRLGELKDFIALMREKYGLGVALRTIVRTYMDYWPREWLTRLDADSPALPVMVPPTVITSHQLMWEICAANPAFLKEKIKRVVRLAGQGLSFIMFDESDWRGPCLDPGHGHAHAPQRAAEHMNAVLDLAKAVHDRCPGVICEVHDPVWPWNSCRYAQTYYRQGWGEGGSYHENWGFEFMWDCINDLKSGKALSTYYYAMGCDIPLYLHINMAADNDECIFFWWAASTIRHLGLGGRDSHPTVTPPNGIAPYDHERRFADYAENMKLYRRCKPYFVRGRFTGIAENVHLHTLPDRAGGVVNVFNLSDSVDTVEFELSDSELKGCGLPVNGADSCTVFDGGLRIGVKLAPMSHRLVIVG